MNQPPPLEYPTAKQPDNPQSGIQLPITATTLAIEVDLRETAAEALT